VDDTSYEGRVPDDELEAVRRELAGLGQEPLPEAVATRLDARLAAELASSPLSARRARRRHVQLGASLSAVAAVAAAVVFALSSSGGGHPAPEAVALGSSVASPKVAAATAGAADSAAKTAIGTSLPLNAKRCAPPASRTGGDRPRAGCPGARGGHARAV
jgi:hypothetical protein